MAKALPVLILLPPAGTTPAETWMGQARLAAALDLLDRLKEVDAAGEVHVVAARPEDAAALAAAGAVPGENPPGPFHFGSVLAEFASGRGREGMAYFGGASAPLASAASLAGAFAVSREPRPSAAVNNLNSTDWFVINDGRPLLQLASSLDNDNPLGWRLKKETGCTLRALPACAATRADIDTPADVFLLSGHPDLGLRLQGVLQRGPPEMLARVGRLRQVLLEQARTLAVIGRSSSYVWRQLEERGQIWVRLFVEERGMLANGRAGRGEVRSLIGHMIDDLGPDGFVDRLSSMADAVLWDTRVWMAHAGTWPPAADRFAADMGWDDQVALPDLRRLTAAVSRARIPILCGGHGVVAGAVLALLETL